MPCSLPRFPSLPPPPPSYAFAPCVRRKVGQFSTLQQHAVACGAGVEIDVGLVPVPLQLQDCTVARAADALGLSDGDARSTDTLGGRAKYFGPVFAALNSLQFSRVKPDRAARKAAVKPKVLEEKVLGCHATSRAWNALPLGRDDGGGHEIRIAGFGVNWFMRATCVQRRSK
jgi:hypothetical protein